MWTKSTFSILNTLVLRPLRSTVLTMPIVGPYRRFRYSEFSTCDDCGAKLDKRNNHSDEITVAFQPDDIYSNTLPDSSDIHIFECDSKNVINHGIKVELDRFRFATSHSFGVDEHIPESGPLLRSRNKRYKKFQRVNNFETCGTHYFTLIMRCISREKKKKT